uniref:Nucleoside-diphosphate kinase n=1 Tax=Varanus komodoensis TaxID=61221 RepID=A0A8D2L989_VARKO
FAAEKLQSPIIVFMIGGPGCGKAVQSSRMAVKYNFYHIAIGELLREESSRATNKGKAIRDILLKGTLVPSVRSLTLLTDNMLKAENVSGFIIEGFPREINQAKLFEEVVTKMSFSRILTLVTAETMIQRLLIRGQMGGRVDDHERIIRQRLETHYSLCEPVLTHYLQKSILRNVAEQVGCTLKSYLEKIHLNQ